MQLTLEQLAGFDGRDEAKPLLLAVRGRLYDVSAGKDFYGPGGAYHVFAGKECSRALATMQVKDSACNGNLEDLDEKQLKTLADWEARFSKKYGIVGEVIQDGAA